MISGVTPCFGRSFLSSMTQIGPWGGLKPAQASRSFSCAMAAEVADSTTVSASESAHLYSIIVSSLSIETRLRNLARRLLRNAARFGILFQRLKTFSLAFDHSFCYVI